jgi:preprotein translocase SecE subunit
MNIQQVWSELRAYPGGILEEIGKISWPSRHRTLNLTLMVAAVVAVSTLFIVGVDTAFTKLITLVIGHTL